MVRADNDSAEIGGQGFQESGEDTQEENMGWLLDLDRSEPEEKLFSLDAGEYQEAGLSEYEAELAARPLTSSGQPGVDDLSLFVEEEIVVSSESGNGNIFSSQAERPGGSGKNSDLASGGIKVIDQSRKSVVDVPDISVEDGSDILGLAEEDDMGEALLTIKRVKAKRPVATPKAKKAPAETVLQEQVPDISLEDSPVIEETGILSVGDSIVPGEMATQEAGLIQDLPGTAQESGDWLGDIDLELVEMEADLEEELPVQAEPEVDDKLSAQASAASDLSGASEWLGSSDLELYEMVDNAADDTDLAMTEEWFGEDVDLAALALSADEAEEEQLESLETAESATELHEYEPIDLDLDEILIDMEAEGLAPEEAADAVILSEAPGTSLVAEPGEHTVANEESTREEVAAGNVSGVVGDNVLEYVAQHKPPVSDDEFDEYLLRGAHLAASTPDLEDLEVARTEGIVSVDPGTEVEIDYHDDFKALEGSSPASVTAITSVITAVMEEISAMACNRMAQLGLATDAIEVDVMLGFDPSSIEQCRSEGYEQVSTVCTELPAALEGLGEAEVDAIYVRIFNGQSNESRNDLFRAEEIEAEAEVVVEDEAVAGDEIFGDDVFGADFMDDLEEGILSAAPADDIDALFDDLVGSADTAGVTDEFEMLSQSEDNQDSEVSEAVTALAAEVEEDQVPADIDEIELSMSEDGGFGDDILSAEFTSELEEVPEAKADDIDTVFAGLELGEADTGEICGVDVDEFSESEDEDMLDAVAEYAQTASAGRNRGDEDMGWCIPEGIAFSYSSQGGSEIFADFLDAFIEEGTATVEKLEDAIGEWEKEVSSEAAFSPVMRILHTLKGIAKGVGLQRYGTLMHNFETLLEGIPRPESGAEAEYFRIVNAWLDASVRGLDFVRENRIDIASELPGQYDEQESVAALEPAEHVEVEDSPVSTDATSQQAVSERSAARQKKRDQQLADEGAKALAAQQSVRITSEKLDHLLNLTNQAQQLGVRSTQSASRGKRASTELQGRLSSVRTHIAKIADRALLNVNARGDQPSSELDALEMDQYSELQEAANILREAVEDLADLVDVSSRHNTVLEAQLKQQATVISTISSSIQAARVVPVSRLMPGLRRIVRTVSTDLDKSVAFKVLNETGVLDRDYYARCQVILEHMVRNALDHGIESPEERLAVGKATTGRIAIDVRKSGADYYITLTDDGRGIDPYEMRESAFRKGLDIDVDALSDEEAIQLIFHKGFSTANTVSEVSGRGVGMDIVLSELQQIGGGIKVQSTVGLGTTFEVHVPANVTVNGALLVSAGNNSYAIPLNGLVAVDHVPVEEFFKAVEQGEALTLSDVDCDPAYLATLCHGMTLPDRDAWGDTVPVIIAGSDKRYMAIAVDGVEEALELIIRSLGPQFANVPGVAGGATTADGEAIVALDLNMLVESVAAGKISPVAVDDSKDRTLLALVVDDSRTQRMVTTSQFDTVGVETITAENGLVAIDLLNTTHRLPDVVLLDVEMPVKDGIETLREIRKSMRYKHLPVIMVTSRTGAKHRALAEEAGCDGYMGKPFNFPGLIEQISQLTGYDLHVS